MKRIITSALFAVAALCGAASTVSVGEVELKTYPFSDMVVYETEFECSAEDSRIELDAVARTIHYEP